VKTKVETKKVPREWETDHPWIINVPDDSQRSETLLYAAKATYELCHAIGDKALVVVQDCTFLGSASSNGAPALNIGRLDKEKK
jgi:hypothetical protein